MALHNARFRLLAYELEFPKVDTWSIARQLGQEILEALGVDLQRAFATTDDEQFVNIGNAVISELRKMGRLP